MSSRELCSCSEMFCMKPHIKNYFSNNVFGEPSYLICKHGENCLLCKDSNYVHKHTELFCHFNGIKKCFENCLNCKIYFSYIKKNIDLSKKEIKQFKKQLLIDEFETMHDMNKYYFNKNASLKKACESIMITSRSKLDDCHRDLQKQKIKMISYEKEIDALEKDVEYEKKKNIKLKSELRDKDEKYNEEFKKLTDTISQLNTEISNLSKQKLELENKNKDEIITKTSTEIAKTNYIKKLELTIIEFKKYSDIKIQEYNDILIETNRSLELHKLKYESDIKSLKQFYNSKIKSYDEEITILCDMIDSLLDDEKYDPLNITNLFHYSSSLQSPHTIKINEDDDIKRDIDGAINGAMTGAMTGAINGAMTGAINRDDTIFISNKRLRIE